MIGIGGIGAVAQAQDTVATDTLEAYNRPLSVSVIDTSRDWAARQRIAYAAILGLLQKDFLTLTDWTDQIRSYSQANTLQLSGPLAAIAAKTKLNLLSKNQVTYEASLQATVGQDLANIDGFTEVYAAPQELVTEADQLAGTLGVA